MKVLLFLDANKLCGVASEVPWSVLEKFGRMPRMIEHVNARDTTDEG